MHPNPRHLPLLAAASLILLSMLVGSPAPATAGQPGPGSSGHGAPIPSLGTAREGSAPTGDGPSAIAYDPDTDTIYVGTGWNADGPNSGASVVTVIDGRHCDAQSVRGCKGPWPQVDVGKEPASLAVDSAHHSVYVANSGDQTVSIIDTRTCNGQVTLGCALRPRVVPIGRAPTGVTVDARHHTLFVANFEDQSLSLVDTATCNATRVDGCPTTSPPRVPMPDLPGSVDINLDSHTAYVATLSNLVAFDTDSCNAGSQAGCGNLGALTICDGCYGSFAAVVDDSTNTIYEGDGDTTIVAIDGKACQAGNLDGCATAPSARLTLPQPGFEHVLSLVVDEKLHSVYASFHKSGHVFVLDTRGCNRVNLAGCARQEAESVHVGANPEGVALDEHTHTLYVANERGASVAVIDAARCSALNASGCRVRPSSVPVDSPTAVAVSERVGTAYVASGRNRVAMIDTATCNGSRSSGCGRPPRTVLVGDIPQGVAVDEGRHTVYVANSGSDVSVGSVTVLDTLTCNAHNPRCLKTATLAVPGGHPDDVIVNPRTGTVYVTIVGLDGRNVIAVYDASTCNATTTAGCEQTPSIMPVTSTAPCGGARMAIAVDRTTNTVYAADVSCGAPQVGDQVYVFDGRGCDATHRSGCGDPVAKVTTGLNPFGIVVDEATRTVFVPLLGDGELAGNVALIDARTCNGASTTGCARKPPVTPAGFGSALAAIDSATHQIVVTNVQEGSVSVIDGRRCRAGHTGACVPATTMLPADDYSYGVAIAHSVRTAYVASGAKGTVTVISLRHVH